jgi:hypothetical protein
VVLLLNYFDELRRRVPVKYLSATSNQVAAKSSFTIGVYRGF